MVTYSKKEKSVTADIECRDKVFDISNCGRDCHVLIELDSSKENEGDVVKVRLF